jgi:hypothetical protein
MDNAEERKRKLEAHVRQLEIEVDQAYNAWHSRLEQKGESDPEAINLMNDYFAKKDALVDANKALDGA